MTSLAKIKITKLDAAKTQIETAIKLFFAHGDPISIHTLTCAGYEILMDIGNTKGVAAVLKSPSFVRKDMQKLYLQRINEAENFFKHAKRDPDVILTFQPQATLLLLWDACQMYNTLNPSSNTHLMQAIVCWCFGHDEEMINALTEGNYKDAIKELRDVGAFENRQSFLTSFENALLRQKTKNATDFEETR